MRRVPWRWGLLFLTASAATNVVASSVSVFLVHREFARATDAASFLDLAWRSSIAGLWGLVALLALVTALALIRSHGRAGLRDEIANRPWWVTVATTLLAVFVVAPVVVGTYALGFDRLFFSEDSDSPPGKVRIHNDLGTVVSITRCLKQNCEGQTSHELLDGDHVDYPNGASAEIPDRVVVQDENGTLRCGLEEPSTSLILSRDTDADNCGADVDSMDAVQSPNGHSR